MLIELHVLVLGVSFLTLFIIGFRTGWLIQDHLANRITPTRDQLLGWLYQSPFGWIIIDNKDRVRYLNTRAERLLSIPSLKRSTLFLEDIVVCKILTDLIQTCRGRQKPLRIEWDHYGNELEVYAFSGKKNSVALLFQSRRSLEAQVLQQERWVSDVAHELKTPLTALILVGDSLAATASDHNAVLVERLQKELTRMRDMVLDLLELSRLENVMPGQKTHPIGINIYSLISDVWMGVKPLAESRNVKLSVRINEEVSLPLLIAGDKQRLHRALLNVMDNCLRYSPIGGTIHVDLNANPDWVQIGIRDEGPGLTEVDLEHMFERFYRGDISRCRKERGGSGLGLAIVHQIIFTHGGLVFGENDPAGGARFEIRLPINSNSE